MSNILGLSIGEMLDPACLNSASGQPLKNIPAGSLLRVSLARWWKHPNEEAAALSCHLQLSGWF